MGLGSTSLSHQPMAMPRRTSIERFDLPLPVGRLLFRGRKFETIFGKKNDPVRIELLNSPRCNLG